MEAAVEKLEASCRGQMKERVEMLRLFFELFLAVAGLGARLLEHAQQDLVLTSECPV